MLGEGYRFLFGFLAGVCENSLKLDKACENLAKFSQKIHAHLPNFVTIPQVSVDASNVVGAGLFAFAFKADVAGASPAADTLYSP